MSTENETSDEIQAENCNKSTTSVAIDSENEKLNLENENLKKELEAIIDEKEEFVNNAEQEADRKTGGEDDDSGWDETETLSERLRKLAEEERTRQQQQNQKEESPSPIREGTPSSTVSKQEDSWNKGDDGRNDFNTANQGEQSHRPNIWKELEKMETRARGGGSGGGGGWNANRSYSNRGFVPPRFQKPPDQIFTDNRRPDFDTSGQRFNRGRGRFVGTRRGGGRGRGGGFGDASSWRDDEESYDGGASITKGFGGDNHSSTTHSSDSASSKDGRISKESAAYRSLQITLRGGRGGGPLPGSVANAARQNRNVDHDFGVGDGGGRSRRVYLDRDDDEDDDRESFGSARASPIFGDIRKAMMNLDHSQRSTKHLMTLVLKLADDYCENDSDHWLKLIDQHVMAYAVDRGGAHVEFACSFFVRCIDRSLFQKAAYISLTRHISNLMAPHEWTDKDRRDAKNLCDLFGRLLICTWPPGWDSCAKECNMIVYAVMNVVQTWLRALEKAVTRDAPVREDIAEVSAVCISYITAATGRKLWLKWPDLIDQMYSTLRPVIISQSCRLHGDTKLDLLDLYVKLNEWPKPISQASLKPVVKRDSWTQTEQHVESPTAKMHQHSTIWTPQPTAFEPPKSVYVGHQPTQPNQGGHNFANNQSLFSVPPPVVNFNKYGLPLPPQQQQNPTNIHGPIQQPSSNNRFSFIGPMSKQ